MWSSTLRADLCRRAHDYAVQERLPFYQSLGKSAVVLFPPDPERGVHGNFHPEAYRAVTSNPEWAWRLTKAHAQRERALPSPYDRTACEMDACTSSDALLMNVMCYPGVVAGALAGLLRVEENAVPRFGVAGAVPLANGSLDSTEVDMQIGDTNVEAKLTETSFTTKAAASVERYTDLDHVFEKGALPRTPGENAEASEFASYQLIRNVLAIARKPQARFLVLLDGRRPDLLREWWNIYGAIRDANLRARCGFVFWQEVAAAAPAQLREFLTLKYGL